MLSSKYYTHSLYHRPLSLTLWNSIEEVKKVAPKDRLKVISLEDGLGWEEICPFLEVPIPQETYPRGHVKEEFDTLVYGVLRPKIQAAILRLTTAIVPFVGIGTFYGYKYFRR